MDLLDRPSLDDLADDFGFIHLVGDGVCVEGTFSLNSYFGSEIAQFEGNFVSPIKD